MSKEIQEELPPVNSLSDDDFDKEFETMMRTPEPTDEVEVAEETPSEPSESVDEDVLDNSEVDDEVDSEVEQAGDEDESEEQESDEETADEDDTDETKDSTEEEDAAKNEGFDFNSMPMDQVLPMEINANGMKMKATISELVAGFQKGMHYTKKMQELSGVKKLMSIATSNELSEEDLNLLVEAKTGNKEAIAKLLATAKVDPLEIEPDEHKDYSPSDYGKDEVDVDMDMVVKTIKADGDVGSLVESAIQDMPQDMYDMVSGSAGNLESLYKDIKSGVYANVMPEVVKLQTLYGKSEATIDTYLKVANQMKEQSDSVQEGPQKESSPEEKQTRNNNRKKVASTSKAPTKKKSYIKDDVKSLGEDDFDKEFAKITGRSLNDYR